jgi:hypothetical protein
MWARITILLKTIHTLTLIMQGGETIPIFHGVTIRMEHLQHQRPKVFLKSMQHSLVQVMIRTPILITEGGEIIQTSHLRLKLQVNRP